ncbi:hypothetical protein KIW84_054148 [Lathyrus oleraceus]|uniref:Uncharacterized protein n=1 Tax=Pisum sativum TaxID=3888 RepID=A0A9D4WX53_PEA|nr:hypothetical protein KIW84_054148 [Pisum sativum]
MDGPPDAKDLQPFVLSDIQASNPDVRAVRKAWLKVNLKEERKGKAQELEDSNKRARLLEDQKDDLDHILLGSTSVIRTRKEELKKAEYRICELGRLLDKSLMDKKEIKLDFEAQIRDLRDALKKCEEKLSREILQKEEAERNCHHLRYQLEEATRRFAVLESQEGRSLKKSSVGIEDVAVRGGSVTAEIKSGSLACSSDSSRFTEYWIPAQPSSLRLEQYCSMLLSNSLSLCSGQKSGFVDALCNLIISTRKCCNHPYLLDPTLSSLVTRGLPVEEHLDIGIKASGKLQLLEKTLVEAKSRELRVMLLFPSSSGFGSIGNILDDVLCQRFGNN